MLVPAEETLESRGHAVRFKFVFVRARVGLVLCVGEGNAAVRRHDALRRHALLHLLRPRRRVFCHRRSLSAHQGTYFFPLLAKLCFPAAPLWKALHFQCTNIICLLCCIWWHPAGSLPFCKDCSAKLQIAVSLRWSMQHICTSSDDSLEGHVYVFHRSQCSSAEQYFFIVFHCAGR